MWELQFDNFSECVKIDIFSRYFPAMWFSLYLIKNVVVRKESSFLDLRVVHLEHYFAIIELCVGHLGCWSSRASLDCGQLPFIIF